MLFSWRAAEIETVIGAMTVVVGEKICNVTAGGKKEIRIPPGTGLYSDEIELSIRPGDEVEYRIYSITKVSDFNSTVEDAVSLRGDLTQVKSHSWKRSARSVKQGFYTSIPAVDAIELTTTAAPKVIVAFGDSITAMNRWVKPLAKRLFDAYGTEYALVNEGIGGNCLVYERPGAMYRMFGEMGVKRFQRDVLDIPDLHTVIFALGTNDTSYFTDETRNIINYDALVEATSDIVRKLRERNVRVVAQTLSPRKGFYGGRYTDEMEALRLRYNGWIRSCGLFDYVLDVDALVRDSEKPGWYLEQYHQGDHLHPNQAGGQLIADSFDLEKLVRFSETTAFTNCYSEKEQ